MKAREERQRKFREIVEQDERQSLSPEDKPAAEHQQGE